MILIFKIISLTVIWCLGLKVAFSEGMIFEKIGNFLTKKVEDENKRIYKPLGYCEFCMPSIHTIFGIAFGLSSNIICFSWNIVILYPIFVMGASFVTGIVWALFAYLNTKHELAKNQIKLIAKQEELSHFEIKDRKAKHYQTNKKINGNS